ncbi:MAG: hypothetical protein N2044_03675 [Cyclobacteriaceae bacterium]|nr:hypothetical protein [Cyclobacteriaceae bacterium]MCX7636927.1 hypothetical protein [Cyclobacteriaceae bacterium]MDW8330376.1 hypothetical protein [Cyclobacteriaceae bacterium]
MDDRPGLILSCKEKFDKPYYKIAKMTKTDNSHRFAGLFIRKDTKEGISMNLDFDTFIHLGRIEEIPEFGIRRLKGVCPMPIFDQIKKLCSDSGIDI